MVHRNFLDRIDIGRKIFNIEYKLILFIVYIGLLIFLLISQHNWKTVLFVHIFFVLIFSIFYFGFQFLHILIAPLMAICIPVEEYRIKKYLKKFERNIPEEVVLILGHSDWTKLEAWIKPNSSLSEIKIIVELLNKKGQNFSFYPNASLKDVEEIMSNKEIKEVYLLGHGSSHIFQLGTDDILYYCEFNNPKYGKEFVHQVHCGTPDGKSLIDYVVPEENKKGCFLIRKPINGFKIEKEFKQKIKNG